MSDSSPEPSPKADSEVEVSDQEDVGEGNDSGPSERSASESEGEEAVKSSPAKNRDSSGSEEEVQQQQQSPASSPPPQKVRQSSGSESEHSEKNNDEEANDSDGEVQRKQSTTKDIFGSDSGSDEEENKEKEKRQGSRSPSVEREKPGSDDELQGSPVVHRESQEFEEEDSVRREDGEEPPAPPQDVRISTDIPRIAADLGSEMHFVKFPNFLSVDTHPYDPSWYEDEIDEDEHKDEEGKKRLKLKVENTIRWKSVPDDEGRITRESNARMVTWSDGSTTLHLGSEIFDVHKQALMQGENNHLFIRQGSGLQGQAVFRTKLTFRPHSTDSFTHRKMTLSLADKSSKGNKVRILPNVGLDPEARRSELIKKEEDKLKASIRRENKQRRTRERAIHRGPSAAYLEPDYEEEDEDGGISLSAIKSNYKSRVNDPGYSRTGNYSPQEPDSGDDSDFDVRKVKSEKKKARIVESDEED